MNWLTSFWESQYSAPLALLVGIGLVVMLLNDLKRGRLRSRVWQVISKVSYINNLIP